MLMTLSPASAFGVKIGLVLPRSRLAATTATWPTTLSSASITHHLWSTSWVLAEKVFCRDAGVRLGWGGVMFGKRERESRSFLRSVKQIVKNQREDGVAVATGDLCAFLRTMPTNQ